MGFSPNYHDFSEEKQEEVSRNISDGIRKAHEMDPGIQIRRDQSMKKTVSDPKWIEMNRKRVDER